MDLKDSEPQVTSAPAPLSVPGAAGSPVGIPASIPTPAVAPTPSVVRRTSSLTMESPASALSMQKRHAAEVGPSESVKRSKGRKHSAIDSMASSVDRLAAAFANDGPVASPERKRQAIHAIEDDDDLSEDERIHAYQMIRKDTTFADTLLSIRKKKTRTRYIQSELYGGD